jgi:hypothetical protein
MKLTNHDTLLMVVLERPTQWSVDVRRSHHYVRPRHCVCRWKSQNNHSSTSMDCLDKKKDQGMREVRLRNSETEKRKLKNGPKGECEFRYRILCLRNRQRSLSEPSYFSFHCRASLQRLPRQFVLIGILIYIYKKKKETE